MKLVVDIPEDYYNAIKEIPVEQSTADMMIIHNGTPLKKLAGRMEKDVLCKIRSEIDEQYDRVHPYNISCAEGLEMALEIIDKYRELIGAEGMKEDIFVIVRYALAEPKKETGSFEERNFNFNFVAEKGLDNAIEDINNYILSKYCGEEQKE